MTRTLRVETVDQVRLNLTHCGECGGPMMAVGPRLAFCIRKSCSMCGRGVDDKPLPRLTTQEAP